MRQLYPIITGPPHNSPLYPIITQNSWFSAKETIVKQWSWKPVAEEQLPATLLPPGCCCCCCTLPAAAAASAATVHVHNVAFPIDFLNPTVIQCCGYSMHFMTNGIGSHTNHHSFKATAHSVESKSGSRVRRRGSRGEKEGKAPTTLSRPALTEQTSWFHLLRSKHSSLEKQLNTI